MPGPERPVAASYLALGQSGQHHRHCQGTRTVVDVVSAHTGAGVPHTAAHDTAAQVVQARSVVVLAVVAAVAVPWQVVATERLESSDSCIEEEGGKREKRELDVG